MRDLHVHTGVLELQVREYEHSGSPIIFLHYGGANLMMWQRAVPYFAGRYRLIWSIGAITANQTNPRRAIQLESHA